MIPSQNKKYTTLLHILVFLLALAVIVWMGVITYGIKTTHVALYFGKQVVEEISEEKVAPQKNSLSVGVSNLPSEQELEKRLNVILPKTCKKCFKKRLSCLKSYELDKTLVQGPGYAYLIVDLKTGSGDTYTVTLDHLRGHRIISHEGSVAKKACRDVYEEDEIELDDSFLTPGSDDGKSNLINLQ